MDAGRYETLDAETKESLRLFGVIEQAIRADERARCVKALEDLRVKKPGADLISQGWNRAVDEALKALAAPSPGGGDDRG